MLNDKNIVHISEVPYSLGHEITLFHGTGKSNQDHPSLEMATFTALRLRLSVWTSFSDT